MSRPAQSPGTAKPIYSRQRVQHASKHATPNAKHQADYRERAKRSRPQSYDQQRYLDGKHTTPALAPRVPLDLSSDPAVALYRLEKSRRLSTPDPRFLEAVAALQRLNEADAQRRKGGRPAKFTVGKRNRDLLQRASDRG